MIKWFLAIPHYVVLWFPGIAALCCVIIAWFAILFTGRYPRTLFDFVIGVFRWGPPGGGVRVSARDRSLSTVLHLCETDQRRASRCTSQSYDIARSASGLSLRRSTVKTKTWIIARTRGGWLEPFARKVPVLWPLVWPIAALIDRGPGELLHRYMESGMLKGIKSRVEDAQAPCTRPCLPRKADHRPPGRCGIPLHCRDDTLFVGR